MREVAVRTGIQAAEIRLAPAEASRSASGEISIQPFDPLSCLEEFTRRFPSEMKLFEEVGIHPLRRGPMNNPYTNRPATEDFSNIGQHCLAVAYCASRIAARLQEAGIITTEDADWIVRRSLVHDLTKSFEIMRRDSKKGGAPQEVYGVLAYEKLKPLLLKNGVTGDTADYLVHAGSETGHNSLADFIAVGPDGRVKLAAGLLASKIVHLADDMTFTNIPKEGENPITAFLTCSERMEKSEFRKRYPFLFIEGLAFTDSGRIVPVRSLSEKTPGQAVLGSYFDLQRQVAGAIAAEIKALLKPHVEQDPNEYVKQLVQPQGVAAQSDKAATLPEHHLPLLDPGTIDFAKGLAVVNRTTRYILPIPRLPGGGEPLLYPPGSEMAGQAVKKLADGTPERGVVFFNGEDRGWQAVRGNGEEAVIINDTSKDQARLIAAGIAKLAGSADRLSLQGIKELLVYLRNEVGAIDLYPKKLAQAAKETAPMDRGDPLYVRCIKSEIHRAVLVTHGFVFDGPVRQVYPQGAVLLTDGRYTWGVGAEVFRRNFKAVDAGVERDLNALEQEFGADGYPK